MANPAHVAISKLGPDAVNEWKRNNPDEKMDLMIADLRGAVLQGADLTDAILRGSNLYGSNLRGVNLEGANLIGAGFHLADLNGASLRWAQLGGAVLREAKLHGADLSWADLGLADLLGADLSDSICCGTHLAGLDLSNVHGLSTVKHRGPSYLSVDTLYKSKGRIPEVFLRGCGVPENLIQYLPSLLGQPLQFYTCFISFTETDDAFSERLYNDLQAAGVRCWRWKEDSKWGGTLMRQVDQAIRRFDKVVVICSEDSLKAPPVLREIERALQQEDDLRRSNPDAEVFFPIRLDDFVFKWDHHRQRDVLAKHIGDFCNWNDPVAYKNALDRLIRDLRAEKPSPAAAPSAK